MMLPIKTDDAVFSVENLTDTELDTFRHLAERGATSAPEWQRATWANLADALREVAVRRNLEWMQILADPAVPPNWTVAVQALDAE